MSWHYQLMKDQFGTLSIREYYPNDGEPMWSVRPVAIEGDTVEEIEQTLKNMLKDIKKHGVIDDTFENES